MPRRRLPPFPASRQRPDHTRAREVPSLIELGGNADHRRPVPRQVSLSRPLAYGQDVINFTPELTTGSLGQIERSPPVFLEKAAIGAECASLGQEARERHREHVRHVRAAMIEPAEARDWSPCFDRQGTDSDAGAQGCNGMRSLVDGGSAWHDGLV